MSDPRRDRYYLTTAIAYANNQPGIHTLYEVVASDVIARWHRMCGTPTRFLTGTDEHSVNIAMQAAERDQPPKVFVDEMVGLFLEREGRLGIAPDRFIRTTDPDHVLAAQEMVRRAYRNGDIYLGSYEGWYCPNEGFRNVSDLIEDAAGFHCPNHPDVALQWLTEQQLVLPAVGLPGTSRAPLRRAPRLGPARLSGATRCWASSARAFRTSRSAARTPAAGASRSRSPRTARPPSARTAAGTWRRAPIYVWYDALINYITGAGFPDDPAAFERWWPADLHVIGKDIARFHTIYWPAMLWSAGLEAPRQRLDPRLAARPGRAHEQEPWQLLRSQCDGRCAGRRRHALRAAA